MEVIKSKTSRIIAALILLGLILIYKFYNPIEYNYFPQCPFKAVTGLKCPGCGSQRALHYLLNLNIQSAFRQNALLIFSIPYIMTGFIFDLVKKPNQKMLKWRKIMFGRKAILLILIIIGLFWILRNIL